MRSKRSLGLGKALVRVSTRRSAIKKERQAGEKDKRKKKRRAGNKRTMIKRVDFDKKNYALEKKRESTVLT